MCTLVVFKDMCEGYPLIVAANRDEVPTRPTEGPAEREGGIFAPRDLVFGGSWIGVNRHGLMAALTNRSIVPRNRGRRSRGLLVTEALSHKDVWAAARSATDTAPDAYNGFHMIIADRRDAAFIWTDGNGFHRVMLEPGVHIMTGDGCVAGHSARDELIRHRVKKAASVGDPAWLEELLSFHGPAADAGTCAHGRGVSMESIFSMTIHLPSEADRWRLRWREGRPCSGNAWAEKEIAIEQNAKERT